MIMPLTATIGDVMRRMRQMGKMPREGEGMEGKTVK